MCSDIIHVNVSFQCSSVVLFFPHTYLLCKKKGNFAPLDKRYSQILPLEGSL